MAWYNGDDDDSGGVPGVVKNVANKTQAGGIAQGVYTAAKGGNAFDNTPLGKVGGELAKLNPLNPNNKADPGKLPPVDATGIGGITAPTGPGAGDGVKIASPGVFNGAKIGQVAGPTAAQIQLMGGDSNAFRQAQLNAINGLSGIANGSTPSVAGQAVTNQAQSNIAAQYALANSARGGFNPAALRTAQQNAATMSTDSVQQAAQAQLNEKLQAAGLIGQIGGQGYGLDLDLAKSSAGLQQQATLAGYQGGLQTAIAQGGIDQDTAKTIYTTAAQAGISQGQLDMAYKDILARYAQMGLDAQKANSAAAIDLQRIIQGQAQAQQTANINAQNSDRQAMGSILGVGGQAAAAYIGA